MDKNIFSLANKCLLITGSSSGIGRSIAIECSKMGATIMATGRDLERLHETIGFLQGDSHQFFSVDLTNEEAISQMVNILPKIDGVVHVAGKVDTIPFQFISKNKIDNLFEINFFGSAILSQMLIKQKKINRGGSIVFISSISGNLISYPGNSMYSATKGAINGLVKAMAIDLAPRQIRVNTIMPGMIETELLKDEAITHEQLQEDMKRYPLNRYGKPEEVAYAAIYLLSDASKWVTGSNLLIDGGFTLI